MNTETYGVICATSVTSVGVKMYTAAELKRLYKLADPAKIQRLGQWFMNEYYPRETDPDLFYETDNNKAITYILERYK